jgi:hypothetical protein
MGKFSNFVPPHPPWVAFLVFFKENDKKLEKIQNLRFIGKTAITFAYEVG